jgi:raffinose/stachyose/melibiose transport system substrate-binding protein
MRYRELWVLLVNTMTTEEKKKEKEISRRNYLQVTGGTVVGLALGAALGYLAKPTMTGPGTTTTVTEATTVTKTVSLSEALTSQALAGEITTWTISGPIFEIAQHGAKSYAAANPNVNIKLEQSDETTFEATYNTKFSTAPPPDMAFQYPGPSYTYTLAAANLLLQLDKFAEDNGYDKSNPGYRNYQFNGHYYVMTHDYVAYPFIYYNPDIFSKEGISEPKTLQELYDICDKLRAKGYLSCSFGVNTAPSWTCNVFSFILWNLLDSDRVNALVDAYGTHLTSPSFKDRKLKLTDPEFVKAFALEKEFGDRIYAKGYLGMSDDDAVGVFAQGKAAMYQSGSWGPALLDPVVKNFSYKVFTVPTDFGTVTPKKIASVDNSFAISSRTKSPEICLDFLKHLLGKDEQVWQANNQGTFPARNDIDPSLITNPHMKDNEQLFLLHDPRMVLQLLVAPKLFAPMIDIVTSVLSGTTTPEQAASQWEDVAVKASEAGS